MGIAGFGDLGFGEWLDEGGHYDLWRRIERNGLAEKIVTREIRFRWG